MHGINRKIVNLSLSPPGRDMKRLGVFDLPTVQRLFLEEMITFDSRTAPPSSIIKINAKSIAEMAHDTGAQKALLNLPAFISSSVERELLKVGITPLYAWGTVHRYKVDADFGDFEVVKCRFRLVNFIEICDDGEVRQHNT